MIYSVVEANLTARQGTAGLKEEHVKQQHKRKRSIGFVAKLNLIEIQHIKIGYTFISQASPASNKTPARIVDCGCYHLM